MIPDVDRNEFGTPLLSSVFGRVEERARHDQLLYVNADLILFSDIGDAIRRVVGKRPVSCRRADLEPRHGRRSLTAT